MGVSDLNGGYDEGYKACPCFWGDKPASLVAELMATHDVADWIVLDLGCGEGKNAAALARAGARVTAIDCSEVAVENELLPGCRLLGMSGMLPNSRLPPRDTTSLSCMVLPIVFQMPPTLAH